MKKTIMTLALAALVSGTMFAQEVVNKKGQPILPKAGDIAIGIDIIPVFNYAGNLFNDAGTNTLAAPTFLEDTDAGTTLLGKYFLDGQTAIRGRFGFEQNTTVDKTFVQDATSTDPTVTVLNKDIVSTSTFIIGAGYEMRRGYNRLQGFYGAELTLMFTNGKHKNVWGNDLTATNDNAGLDRNLKDKAGLGIGVGLNGFIGVEYFIMPKISLGAEFAWGFAYFTQMKGKQTTERWDAGSSSVKETETETAGNRESGFGALNPSTGLFLTFHF